MRSFTLSAAVVLGLILPAFGRAQTPAVPPSPGQVPASAASAGPDDPAIDLFVRKCSSCHTVGKGVRVGPDLKGATERRDRVWLESFIKAPSIKLDSDPVARGLVTQFAGVRMPDLGLSDAEITSLADLIDRCSKAPCDLAGKFTPVATATVQDMARGRALFLGEEALKSGAPQCLSCHTVQGAGGGIAGGLLAKDLTNVFGRLGDQGLDAALKSPPFPVMNRIFAARPLQPDEVFALRSFLYDANRKVPAEEGGVSLLLVALLGVGVVLIVLNAAWSGRLRGVRLPLVHRKVSRP
ncbi:MAG: cytochrome c [Vicinamibacteria bacterium]